jgi:hypothetical protein
VFFFDRIEELLVNVATLFPVQALTMGLEGGRLLKRRKSSPIVGTGLGRKNFMHF